MIRLRVLGTLEVESDPDGARSALSAQPKRVALLVYLALESARGSVSRDRLLGMLWPELSESRARRALSQTLYVLRRTLGADVFIGAGQPSLQIDRGYLSCDALEFQELLEQGAREEALSLYGGDLLDGFFLVDTPEFEHWVDDERARLKRRAREAAAGLSQEALEAGDLAAAASWTRRSVRLDPADEDELIRLIELLRVTGNGLAIQQEFKRYRRWIEGELGLEPSARIVETCAAAAKAVERPPAAIDAPLPTDRSSGPNGPTEEPVAARGSPGNRWRASAVVVLVAVAILAIFQTSRQATEIEDSAVPRVLVAPFENQTGDASLEPLARLASDWLSTEIARSGRVTVVPPVSALRLSAELESEADTTRFGKFVAVGAEGGSDLVIGGYLTGRADSAVFEVFGIDPRSGTLLFALEPVGAREEDVTEALNGLRRATMGAVATHLDRRMRQWSGPASRPPSYESYQEYSRALDMFLAGDRASQAQAADLFVEAWRADTTFTAPLLWAVFAMWNSGQGDRADSLAHALEPGATSMPEWDRAMLEYHLAFMHGELAEQYRAAASVVDLAPDSEWRYILALAAKQVGCRDKALSILQDLGSRTGWMSRWSPAYWTVRLDVRHLLGDVEGEVRDAEMAMDQLTDELHPGDEFRPLAAHIRAAAVSGSTARLAEYLGQVRSLGTRGHMVYMKLLYWGPLAVSPESPEHRMIVDSARAWYADRLEQNGDATWYRFARWVLAYRGADWERADSLAAALFEEGWPVSPEYGFGPRAVLAARAGQIGRANALVDSIPSLAHGRSYSDYEPDFFRARIASIQGDPARAVEYLRSANRKGIPYEDVHGIARVDFRAMWDYEPLQRLLAGHSCEGL
jgi:DNA-binding SARP family transcriptional activator/TolB-like protein